MKALPSIIAYLVFALLLAIMPVTAQHNGYADWLVPNFWLIFFFLAKNKVNKYVFLADFFYVYLLNMVFEVYVLLRNLRHKNLS